MPEIAEASNISKKLSKIKINEINILNDKIIKNDISWIKNSQIKDIFNYGKAIVFKIVKHKEEKYLLSQLGMTGSWFNNYSRRNDKHTQLELIESNNKKIIYSDIRKFGNLRLYNSLDEIIKDRKWSINLEKESKKKILKHFLSLKSEKVIKDFLLDQRYFTGIGNYLASEILFHAKINPYKSWNRLSDTEIMTLIDSIKYIISQTKRYGGFSFYGGYILPDGTLGNYKDHALIYRKKYCLNCNNDIIKEYINNRATYYCKKCQKI